MLCVQAHQVYCAIQSMHDFWKRQCASYCQACSPSMPVSYCTFAIPTMQLWFACFIANAVLVYLVIPFAMFYYEADSDACALTL